jgi:hypothetical protein
MMKKLPRPTPTEPIDAATAILKMRMWNATLGQGQSINRASSVAQRWVMRQMDLNRATIQDLEALPPVAATK